MIDISINETLINFQSQILLTLIIIYLQIQMHLEIRQNAYECDII